MGHSTNSSSLVKSLPSLDFENPFLTNAMQNDAATFLPLHMEKNYAYPLIIWLSGSNVKESRLPQVMPKISMRNYIGVAPLLDGLKGKSVHEQVFECLDKAKLCYNINSSRIFVAGCAEGGSLALELTLTHSEYFAGAISLGGFLPATPSILGDLRSNRKKPIFLAQTMKDEEHEPRFFDDLRVLYTGGFSVTARQYPEVSYVDDQILNAVDHWIMEIINGYDMTTTENTIHETN